MIELKKICVSFDGKKVLENLSITFRDGEFVCLLGASGCGKTTILRVASGLMKPDSGEVIKSEPQRQSFVFQENRLFPGMTRPTTFLP